MAEVKIEKAGFDNYIENEILEELIDLCFKFIREKKGYSLVTNEYVLEREIDNEENIIYVCYEDDEERYCVTYKKEDDTIEYLYETY